MREIKTAALIGLGAIGGYVAPRLETALGQEGFTVIAGGERKRRLEQEGCCINDTVWKFHIGDPEEAEEPADLVIFPIKSFLKTELSPKTQYLSHFQRT